jgi:hypothetical protein
MKKTFYALIVAIIILHLAAAGNVLSARAADAETNGDYISEIGDNGTINWTTKALRVKGNGFGPSRVKELGRRKILAKRAAKLDAYRNLIEVIKGVHVTSATSVESMMMESDFVKAKAGGMVKGMRLVDVHYTNDGGCEITMEVSIDRQGQFLLEALNTSAVTMKDDYPKFDWVAMRKKLDETRTKLSHARLQYAITREALREKGRELDDTNLKLAHLEERLTTTNTNNTRLKDQLVSAQNELTKSKNIVKQLVDRYHREEIKSTTSETELKMTQKFLKAKEGELVRLSAEMEKYNKEATFAKLDRERLLGYVQRIREIQRETKKRVTSSSQPANQRSNQSSFQAETPPPNKKKPYTDDKRMQPERTLTTVSERTPQPTPQPANENYTGLLVDARGIELDPVLAPSILNEKKEKMYGIGVIPKEINSGSTAAYIRGNLEHAKQYKNVGNNPLVVKCIKTVNRSDLMLDEADARKVTLIPDLLEEKKVTILF